MRIIKELKIDNKKYCYYLPNVIKDISIVEGDCENYHQSIKEFVCKEWSAIDVGARDGDSLLFLKSLFDGKIFCFEPSPEYDFLLKNIEINDFKDVYTFNYGIAEQSGVHKFLWDTENRNGGIDTPEIRIVGWGEEKNFSCFSFADLPEELKNDLFSCNFIKTDTEGFDLKVLNQLLPIIKEKRPVILMEWWCGLESQMAHFANNVGYKVFDPYSRVFLSEINPYKRCHDLLLIP